MSGPEDQAPQQIIVKHYGVHYARNHNVNYHQRALTLPHSAVTTLTSDEMRIMSWWQLSEEKRTRTRTHESGWTISGKIHNDWFSWVNAFEAHHPTYGQVWGDFEKEVYVESEEAFEHFWKHHPPRSWDYGDI